MKFNYKYQIVKHINRNTCELISDFSSKEELLEVLNDENINISKEDTCSVYLLFNETLKSESVVTTLIKRNNKNFKICISDIFDYEQHGFDMRQLTFDCENIESILNDI